MENSYDYLNRRTLILGDVNRGKTQRSAAILEAFCRDGRGAGILLLDLAPDRIRGIGGKMPRLSSNTVEILTCRIAAPRLTGRDAAQVQALAEQNARAIEPLLKKALTIGRSILAVNDASLYLQAGRPDLFMTVLGAFPTAVINAYRGDSLPGATFTQNERLQVAKLARACDQVIDLNRMP